MGRVDEGFGVEVVVLGHDHADQLQDALQGRRLLQHHLQLLELLGF
jgi:hypothetical protein